MIERIKIADLLETHFCVLPFARHYRNRDYRTLVVETWPRKNGAFQSLNLIQCRDYRVRQKLAFSYPDELKTPAVSLVEMAFNEIDLPMTEARKGAPSLSFDHRMGMTAGAFARWAKKNCRDRIVLLEGNGRSRASFASDEDYLLARLALA